MSAGSKDRRTETGRLGEEAAARHLASLGYRILDTNWRCRSGELDIVAQDGDTVVFAEVRTRTTVGKFGRPLESVDWRKQRKVVQVASLYLHQHKLQGRSVRFDAIGVTLSPNGGKPELTHVVNAFA